MTLLTDTSTAYDRRQFDDNFPPGVENHYWFRARTDALHRTLASATRRGWMPRSARIVEVGCGPGIVVAGLRARGHDVVGVELGVPPRRLAPQHMHVGIRADELDRPTRDAVDALLLLDVIEHVPDDAAFLAETLAAFPRCGTVVITVPADPALWSDHDRHYGHFRRYTRSSLTASLAAAGLEPYAMRSMFRSLHAAARLIQAAGANRNPTMQAPRDRGGPHRLLAGVLALEDRLLGASPLRGLSLLTVAKRVADPIRRSAQG